MNEELLKRKIESMAVWKKWGQRAPHKPLLLLYALGQLKNKKVRFLPYIDVKAKLTSLLEKYGPKRQSYHPEEPFVRLTNDGLWTLTPDESLNYSNPSNSYLIRNNVYGGFTEEIYKFLIDNNEVIHNISQFLLNKHFPNTIHDEILADVGLKLDNSLEVNNLDNGEFQKEQLKLNETIENIKDRTYYVWETIESKKNQFKNGFNKTGDDIAYRVGKMEANTLNRALKEPYYGRFDTVSKEFGSETFYIGKQGVKNLDEEIVVVDWRMPISSVYYNFTPGKSQQQYTVINERKNQKETFNIEVTRKKEFTIKDSRLMKVVQQVAAVNSELNTTYTDQGAQVSVTDDFLREILENSETTGYLKEIIATIQHEQNIAIRQPIDKNIIIQGVAGSGKSSIALHRLSFLLYNNKNVKPENVLIVGPTNMFISSFQGLLPDLNLDGIKQSTFQLLALQYLRPFIKNKINASYSDYFENTLFREGSELERKRIEFKGSESFSLLIDILVEEYKNRFSERFKSFSLFETTLFTEDLQKIFDGYSYLPFSKRVEKFIEHVGNYFKTQLDTKIDDIRKQYEFIKDSYVKGGGLAPLSERNLVRQIKEIYEFKKGKLEKEYKESVNEFKERMVIPDPVTLYKQILSYEMLLSFTHEIGNDTPKIFQNYEVRNINYFDLPPLFYIYLSLYGSPEKYSHLVIDEAQDFSYMHFLVLKRISKTMTILGDKDQSIFLDYGQENWEKVKKLIFNSNEDTLLEMNNSYRSTKEIIELANNVLINQYGLIHKPITPINRSGPQVDFEMVNNGEELINKIIDTITNWKNKYKRIAIIHKDEKKAKKLSDYLNSEFGKSVVYINPEEDVKQGFISVLASYNSKGMEFDGVILVNVNEETFPKDDLHARLLYVLLTRAQQEVKAFYQDTHSPLLDGYIKPLVRLGSKFDDIL